MSALASALRELCDQPAFSIPEIETLVQNHDEGMNADGEYEVTQ